MQALPMDFRESYRKNNLHTKFIPVLKNMKKLTGKKVVVVAHSMGNLNVYYNVMRTPVKLRKELIYNVLSAGPPFLGSPEVTKSFVYGTNDYYKFGLGINFKNFQRAVDTELSLYELLPTDFFVRYQNETTWMPQISRRADYENFNKTTPDDLQKDQWYNETEKNPFPWFPARDKICNTLIEKDSNHTDSCRSNFYDYKNFLQIGHKHYGAGNYNEMFLDVGMPMDGADFFDWTRNNNLFSTFENPQIPWATFYANHMPTVKSMYYEKPPPVHQTDFMQPEKTEFGFGDDRVPVLSAISPLLKWAWEFDNKESLAKKRPGFDPKPMTFVQYCSGQQQRRFYNTADKDGVLGVSKNDYIGWDCECKNFGDKDGCTHPLMVQDESFVGLVGQLVVNNQRTEGLSEWAQGKTNRELYLLSESCG
jgi:hypothetical protein